MKKPKIDFPVELLDAAVELLGSAGRSGTVRVQGASMMPMLRPGQVLAVDFAPSSLRCGDLLVFRQADYLVVHRLLGHTRFPDGSPGLRTRGDAVIGLDPRLDPQHVVGRVTKIESESGWLGVRSPAARRYGLLLAAHDLFWAAWGSLARWLDWQFRKLGWRTRLRDGLQALDRSLLGLAHRLLFRLCHAPVEAPTGDGAGS